MTTLKDKEKCRQEQEIIQGSQVGQILSSNPFMKASMNVALTFSFLNQSSLSLPQKFLSALSPVRLYYRFY